jgi:hypothetical protein
MCAHDSILAHRVKEIKTANRKRIPSPFEIGDLVYVSSKNLSIPKGLARKFYPKYVGPYPIIQNFNNESFKLGISKSLRQRGIHDVFHSSLLRVHVANNDRLFPNCSDVTLWESSETGQEWAVSRIKTHSGKGRNAIFEIEWKSGDVTWLPYHKIDHLTVLQQYFEACGIEKIDELENGKSAPTSVDPQVLLGYADIGDPFNDYDEQAQISSFIFLSPPSNFTSYFFCALSNIPFSPIMPDIDWCAPHALINNLKSNFPFIFAGEPAIWTIRDITDPERPVFRQFSPALMRSYNQFDSYLRNHDYTHHEPIRYSDFARIFNNHNNTPFGYTYWDKFTSIWVTPQRKHVSYNDLDLLEYAIATPPDCNTTLMDIGMADANGHTKS